MGGRAAQQGQRVVVWDETERDGWKKKHTEGWKEAEKYGWKHGGERNR